MNDLKVILDTMTYDNVCPLPPHHNPMAKSIIHSARSNACPVAGGAGEEAKAEKALDSGHDTDAAGQERGGGRGRPQRAAGGTMGQPA